MERSNILLKSSGDMHWGDIIFGKKLFDISNTRTCLVRVFDILVEYFKYLTKHALHF